LVVLAVLLTAPGCASQKDAQSRVDSESRRLMELQRQRQAVVDEKPIPADLPQASVQSHEKLGDNYLKQDNAAMAFVEYRKALAMEPGNPYLRYKIGRLLVRKGLYEEALNEFNVLIEKDPKQYLGYQGKAETLLAMGRVDASQESALQAVKLSGSWRTYALLGRIYQRQKKFPEAVESYSKATSLNPKSVALYNDLGITLFTVERDEEAVQAFLKALGLDPANQIAYNNMGLALFRLKQYDQAFEAFKRGSDEAAAYNNIGVLYMRQENYAPALEAFEKAVEAKPSYYEQAQENMRKAKEAMARVRQQDKRGIPREP
jgi:tetratricopeptide (TPR) repeat protein